MRRGRPERKGWKPKFLRALCRNPNVARACRLSCITQVCAYDHRNKYPEFAKQWDEAIETGFTLLEELAFKIASGIPRSVWKTKRGIPVKVETETVYDGSMMRWLLASRYAKYRDQSRVEHVGAVDAPPMQIQQLPPILPKEMEDGV